MSNIVKAVFTDSRIVTTSSIFSQKYGQILQIEGLELPETFEVDFCNTGDSITTPQMGSNNQVPIPDICLKSCRPIKAYIVLHSGSSDGGTEYEINIPLKYRPEHGYDEPTDVQQDVITTAIAALTETVNNTKDIIGTKSYETILGGLFDATTASYPSYIGYYARASVTGRIPKVNDYRVTFDETVYELPCRLYGFVDGQTPKVVEYLGNLGLYENGATSGLTHPIDDVPFLIISDLDDHSAIDVFTEVAGQHTFLIEKIIVTGTKINNYPIYSTAYSPIEKVETTGTYCGVSIGAGNNLVNKRGTVAIGSSNTLTVDGTSAIGLGNTVNGGNSIAIGSLNTVGGISAVAIGGINETDANYAIASGYKSKASGSSANASNRETVASGGQSHAEGYKSVASGTMSHAEGRETVASGSTSHAEGRGTIANHRSQHVFGEYNVEDASTAAASAKGDYVEIVGNGSDDSNRSNARTLDWNGNEAISGSLTIGKGSVEEVTITPSQLDRLVNTSISQDNINRLHGLFSAVTAGVTERVENGTRIMNQITSDNIAAQLGYFYNSDDDKLQLYCVFGKTENVDSISYVKYYSLVYNGADNIEEDFELTYENAPHVTQRGAGTDTLYKLKLNSTNFSTKSPFMCRLCNIAYDANDNEIARYYSSQYKYVYDNGAVTRTRFQTSLQTAEVIEDVGIHRITISVGTTFAFIDKVDKELLSMVNTDEAADYRFIIPDSMYDNAPYGYSISARDGQHRIYRGPTIYKASEGTSGSVASDQGVENAGKFLVVGNDGVVVPTSMPLWQGGSY